MPVSLSFCVLLDASLKSPCAIPSLAGAGRFIARSDSHQLFCQAVHITAPLDRCHYENAPASFWCFV